MVRQNKSIKNFWMIFFGTIAALAIATAVILTTALSDKVARMRMSQVTDENVYKISQENNYKRALYSACDSMKNIDANLGKIAVSQDTGHQVQMLTDVVIHANEVNKNIGEMPIEESDNLASCQRFVNQTQDYAKYLLGKLGKGNQLSDGERAALMELDDVATRLYDVLEEYSESDSGMFITNGNGINNVGALSESFGKVENNAFTYEKLIYDGPFSESVEKKTLSCDGKLSHEDAAAKVAETFGEGKFIGEINNEGLLYVFETSRGRVLTDCTGRTVQYETYAEPTGESNVDCAECIAIAEEFCAKLGYDVKGVWVSKTQDAVTYVNCATVTDGVVVYPDLIKVAVSSDGEVVGLEAKAYLINHRDWDVSFGDVSEADALKAVNGALRVTNTAKALIEKNGEYLACYEFEAMMGDRQYYVYVDSRTGEEAELFKVIQNTEGYTVM